MLALMLSVHFAVAGTPACITPVAFIEEQFSCSVPVYLRWLEGSQVLDAEMFIWYSDLACL